MPDKKGRYDANFKNAIAGQVDMNVGSGPYTKIDANADVRDLVTSLVMGQKAGITPTYRKEIYDHLTSILGKDTTNKLVDHVNIFNTRNDLAGKNYDQVVSQFYNLGSKDPTVDKILQSSRNINTADATLGIQRGINPNQLTGGTNIVDD